MWFSCFSCLSSYLCGSSFFFFFPFYLVLSTFLLLQNEIGWKWTNIHIFEWPYLVNLYILLHHSVKIDRFHYIIHSGVLPIMIFILNVRLFGVYLAADHKTHGSVSLCQRRWCHIGFAPSQNNIMWGSFSMFLKSYCFCSRYIFLNVTRDVLISA